MKKTYSMQEIADLLGYSVASIYSYERQGYIHRLNHSDFEGKSGRFSADQVEKLLEMKKELDAAGSSFADLAKALNIHPGKVKDAARILNLNVKKVQTSVYSTRTRYALTLEQEQEIVNYFNQYKPGRPRRNALYYTHMDLAEHQLFLLNAHSKVRLKEDSRGIPGFEIEHGDFLPYREALQKYTLKPAYSIHQLKQSGGTASYFTDLIVPTYRADFYKILDTLYSVCGVENFNTDYHNDKIFISIRNGDYPLVSDSGNKIKGLIEQYIVYGEIKVSKDQLTFGLAKSVLEIQLDPSTYEILTKEAKEANLPLTVFIQLLLQQQAFQLKNDLKVNR